MDACLRWLGAVVIIQKESLIQIHMLLVSVRVHLVSGGSATDDDFVEYDRLNVRPTHVHLSKQLHIEAMNTLGNCLARLMKGKERGATWHLVDSAKKPTLQKL